MAATSPLPPQAGIDAAILEEAAGWMVTLQSGAATANDHAALSRWRTRSPAHEAAWQRAESLFITFGEVPAPLGRETLVRLQRPRRRRTLRLALLAMALPGSWLAWQFTPWREWSADLRTATGERRTVELADGTRLVLNTATSVDLAFTATERRMHLLDGEILVTTGQDASIAPRPFTVLTAQGRLQPLGTRFMVTALGGSTRVGVLEGAVQVRPSRSAQAATVHAGEQLRFSATRMQPAEPLDTGAALWERGMLLARGMPLGELVAQLARYRLGVLRCDPSIATMPVSGAFPLFDTDASLKLLQDTLPVRLEHRTALWTTVRAR